MVDSVSNMIDVGNIDSLHNLSGMDASKDLIQVYLCIDTSGNSHLVEMLNPVEFFFNPSTIRANSTIQYDPSVLSRCELVYKLGAQLS